MSDFLQTNPLVETVVWIAGIGVLAWLANSLTRRYLLRVISRVVAQTRFTWDDIIFDRKVFGRLAHIAPAVVVYYGVAFVPGIPANLLQLAQRVALGFMVLVVVLSVDRLLTALNDIYSLRPDAKSRPIKGYLQILKIALYVAAGIVVISTLV
ncbi:MAG: mechanosensitive ion channel family protein, partial [Gemmatimonadales bacterium]